MEANWGKNTKVEYVEYAITMSWQGLHGKLIRQQKEQGSHPEVKQVDKSARKPFAPTAVWVGDRIGTGCSPDEKKNGMGYIHKPEKPDRSGPEPPRKEKPDNRWRDQQSMVD